MNSVSIFVSNDLVTDQRMHRFAETLYRIGWQVEMTGRLKRSSQPLVPLHYVVHRVHVPVERGIFFYLLLNFIFFIKALRSRSEVLWSVDLDTLPAVRLAAFLRKKTFVWDCHEIFPFMPELYSHPWKQHTWQAVEYFFAPGLKNTLTVNESVRRYLAKLYDMRPSVVHNYPVTTTDHIPLASRLNSTTVLFQGAINEGRCLETLIRSMQGVHPVLKLIIAGEGPLRNQLEALTRTLGLTHRIQFTGELIPPQLKILTDQARIGISLLDKSHFNSFVSLANKNLDYIMSGLPAITVDFPEYRAINAHWEVARMLSVINEETVSKAINQMYSDTKDYESMVRNCLDARQELCWEKEEQKFIHFMDDLPV